MKLSTNTVVPKIMEIKSEMEIIKKVIGEIVAIYYIEDNLQFASELEKLIKNFPNLKYLKEEMESVKENIIDVFDGYETRNDSLVYLKFMEKVLDSAQEYMKNE